MLARSIQTIVAHAGDTLSYLMEFLLGFLHGHDGGLASHVDTAASPDSIEQCQEPNPHLLRD